MDERHFFTEEPDQRQTRLQCPRCRRTSDYKIRWIRRRRKAQVPPGADARARELFAKVKDHLVRVDDDVTCKTCGKRFEIPSHRALIFLEELEGLPKEEEEEEEEEGAPWPYQSPAAASAAPAPGSVRTRCPVARAATAPPAKKYSVALEHARACARVERANTERRMDRIIVSAIVQAELSERVRRLI